MIISIQYNNIHITMTNNKPVLCDSMYHMCTHQALKECLYRIVDKYQMRGKPGFYLANLYVYSSDNPKYANDHIVQHQFNEAIQLFIDIKEQHHICSNVNKVYLAIQFQCDADRNTTALITKLLCLLKPKDVEIYMHHIVHHSVLAELTNNGSFLSRGELSIHNFNSKTVGCSLKDITLKYKSRDVSQNEIIRKQAASLQPNTYQSQHEVIYNQPHSDEDHTERSEVQSISTKRQSQLTTEHCNCHHNCSLSLIKSDQDMDIEDSIQLQDLFYPDEGSSINTTINQVSEDLFCT